MADPRILIVGNAGGSNVGQSLLDAAPELGVEARLLDARRAWASPAFLRAAAWRLGRRAPRRRAFARSLLAAVAEFEPDVVLAAGLAPVTVEALIELGRKGVRRIVFLTDDPWNDALFGPSARATLPYFDQVFTPRTANVGELRAASGAEVRWLPFGYDAALFRPADPSPPQDADVFFAGGADATRAPILGSIAAAGHALALYGDYWDRFRETRGLGRGRASPESLAGLAARARVSLCLVREANRDGHAMRSLELPAVGACMLAQDTAEHRELLGDDGVAVAYFQDGASLLDRLAILLAEPAERARLARAAYLRISRGGHTYAHRLRTMLSP